MNEKKHVILVLWNKTFYFNEKVTRIGDVKFYLGWYFLFPKKWIVEIPGEIKLYYNNKYFEL